MMIIRVYSNKVIFLETAALLFFVTERNISRRISAALNDVIAPVNVHNGYTPHLQELQLRPIQLFRS